MAYITQLLLMFSVFGLNSQANAQAAFPRQATTAIPATTIELQTSKPLSSISNSISDRFVTPKSSDREIPEQPTSPVFKKPTPIPVANVDLNAVCGTVVPQPVVLSANGPSYHEGVFPWHAALYHVKGSELTYMCAASLISRNHILTVAHCVSKKNSEVPLHVDHLVAYLGKYYLKRHLNPGVQDRKISQILSHPRYNARSFSYDIALVRLASSADITDYVRPVCLWQDSADLNSVLDKKGEVIGWGFGETGNVTEHLIQTSMLVLPPETCSPSFGGLNSGRMPKRTYCAAFDSNAMCNGDSGSSMVFPTPNSSPSRMVWQLRGLVSISVALQGQLKCDSSHYALFTDTAKYLNWIRESMV